MSKDSFDKAVQQFYNHLLCNNSTKILQLYASFCYFVIIDMESHTLIQIHKDCHMITGALYISVWTGFS